MNNVVVDVAELREYSYNYLLFTNFFYFFFFILQYLFIDYN